MIISAQMCEGDIIISLPNSIAMFAYDTHQDTYNPKTKTKHIIVDTADLFSDFNLVFRKRINTAYHSNQASPSRGLKVETTSGGSEARQARKKAWRTTSSRRNNPRRRTLHTGGQRG